MNLKNTLTLLTILLPFLLPAHAVGDKPINVGSIISLESKVFGEEKEIQVYLPDSYKQNSSRKYPVLYVIAGQRYFFHGISYQKSLTFENSPSDWFDHSPEFIVVGIKTYSPDRGPLFRTKAPIFISFLEKELIPHIENRYRVLDERVIFGWELAAGLVTEVLANNAELFTSYIISNPSFVAGLKDDKMKKAIERGELENKHVYFSYIPSDGWVKRNTDSLATLFMEKAPNNLAWKQDRLVDGETHYSTANSAFYRGLRAVFGDYEPLKFTSMKEFHSAGGIEGLKHHYQQRGIRYGVVGEVHPFTIHHLIIQSTYENDINNFVELFKVFGGYMKSFSDYDEDEWYTRFGDFAAKHKRVDTAITIYNQGLKRYPRSTKIHKSLGDVYKMKGELEKSSAHYAKASNLAK